MKLTCSKLFGSALLAITAILIVSVSEASGCPFCSGQGNSLSGEVAQADFIVVGTLKNAKHDPNDILKGTTEFTIESAVKPHDYLRGKKTLVIPRFIPSDPKDGVVRYLMFCSLYNRPIDVSAAAVTSAMTLGNLNGMQLDAYRGEPLRPDSKLAEYLQGAIEIRKKDPAGRLVYFFKYLDSTDNIVSADAYAEFAGAEYKEVRAVAPQLSAAKLIAWLKDKNTPAHRLGLYGLLLGHSGKPSDAKTMRELLDAHLTGSGLDGLLVAYILLDTKAGYEYLIDHINKDKVDFTTRYASLKVLRFLWDFRPDLVTREQILDGMKLLVARADMADLPIDDLRKWGIWSLTDYVMGFAQQPSHCGIPIVRRSLLRFALSAPKDNLAATAFVEKMRKEDPERVKLVEELLKEEATRNASIPAK